jgi:hypothetical protein
MSDTPFFRTVMGNRFFSHSVPEAIATMGRIANALERIAAALEAGQGQGSKTTQRSHEAMVLAVQCPPSSP